MLPTTIADLRETIADLRKLTARLEKATAGINWEEVFSIRKQIKKVIHGNRPQPPAINPNPEPNT